VSDTSIAERATTNGHAPDRTAAAADAIQSVAGAAGRLVSGLAKQFQSRIPVADLDERDPDYIRQNLPAAWLFSSLWYRAEVRGLGNIPEKGPVLLIGNHTGGNVAPEVMIFPLAFTAYFGVERRFHQLAHNLVVTMPGLSFLRKYGTMAAAPKNARKALDAGAALLVFPGGDYEVHRPSWERNKVDFGGRKGFIKLALDQNVPIVPVVTIGGQETALFLSRGEWLAKTLGLDRMFRLKVLPISLALPWGLNVGDLMGHIPLPAKITIEVLPPIDLRAEYGPDPDPSDIYNDLMASMQEALDGLAAERRFPIIG
jgi:1-acyl-sn-glycerol-3-phosphate acyltransferase